MFLRSFPLQKRTLNKSSITSPKFSLVSATTTAMGTRGVMLLGTVQAVSFSADPAHGRFPPPWTTREAEEDLAAERLLATIRLQKHMPGVIALKRRFRGDGTQTAKTAGAWAALCARQYQRAQTPACQTAHRRAWA
jgi:hypothetical protein